MKPILPPISDENDAISFLIAVVFVFVVFPLLLCAIGSISDWWARRHDR